MLQVATANVQQRKMHALQISTVSLPRLVSLPPSLVLRATLPSPSANTTILHTGDFRASEALTERTASWLRDRDLRVRTLYLDTTYCNAKVPLFLQPSLPSSLPIDPLPHLLATTLAVCIDFAP
jgi:hypothetical protein